MTQIQKNIQTLKVNCWDYCKCERQIGGNKVNELCACPASVFSSIPDGRYNNGERLGRRCWRIAATLCNNQVQGTFKDKIEECRKCTFYLLVKKEEGQAFVE